MSLDRESTEFQESDIAVLQIIGQGMSEATVETFKKFGEETLMPLLLNTIAAPIAGPLAAGAAALLATFAKRLFQETNSIERRLNKLLSQPFKTASRTVREVLSEEVRSTAEEARATERLKRAADQLDEAYTYAESETPQKRLLVRLYQCLVASLIEGGGAVLRRNMAELQLLALRARSEADRLKADAERARRGDPAFVANAYASARFGPIPMGIPTPNKEVRPWRIPVREILEAEADGFMRRAEQYVQNAETLERLCTLFENAQRSRQELLRADKRSDLRTRLRRWLSFS